MRSRKSRIPWFLKMVACGVLWTITGSTSWGLGSFGSDRARCIRKLGCFKPWRAERMTDERDAMLARQGGQEPRRRDDVLLWLQVTMTALASADAVYVLAAASLEAFTNEVLSTQFPDVFAELETNGRRPPRMKFRRMCELLGLSTTAKWFAVLDTGLEGRKEIVHHQPQYRDDSRLDLEPLGTLDAPISASEFMDALDEGFTAVFRAFGVAVPKTHRPIEDSELEMTAMLGL